MPCYGEPVGKPTFVASGWVRAAGVATAVMAGMAAYLAASVGLAVAETANGIAPLGADFEVTAPVSAVGVPSACMRSDGSFAVVRSEGAEAGGQILLRRLDAQGKPQGSEFVVSTYAGQYASDPDVACGVDGGFAVVWTDRVPLADENDGTLDDDVLARVFGTAGTPLADPFRVNEQLTGNQNDAAVCALGGGAFAVIWQDRKRDEIDTRVIQPDGTTTAVAQVTEDPRAYMPPDVACSGGKYVVVWGDFPSPEVNDEVEGRVFSADGAPTAPRFFVNSYTTGDQGYPVACGASDKGFVIAWRDAPNRHGIGNIKARQFSSSGAPAGAGLDVSPEGRDRAALVCGADRSFVVTTHALVEGEETLHAQAVDSDRELVGNEALVHDGTTTLAELAPPLAGDGAGRFLVVWPAPASPAGESIRGRFFRVGPVEVTTTTTEPATTTTQSPTTSTTVASGDGECGDAVSSAGDGASAITIADALAVLRAAVGSQACVLCRCDTNGSGTVTVEDALRVLRHAVGISVELNCPAC